MNKHLLFAKLKFFNIYILSGFGSGREYSTDLYQCAYGSGYGDGFGYFSVSGNGCGYGQNSSLGGGYGDGLSFEHGTGSGDGEINHVTILSADFLLLETSND